MADLNHEPWNDETVQLSLSLHDFAICRHCGCLYTSKRCYGGVMAAAPDFPCAVRASQICGSIAELEKRRDI